MKTFYDYLGVSNKASQEEIETAYRKRVLETHPDRGGDSIEFQNVRKGYSILSDPGKRRDYDEWLKNKGYKAASDNPVSDSQTNQEEKGTDYETVQESAPRPEPKPKKKSKIWLWGGLVLSIIVIILSVIPLYRNMLIRDADKIFSGDDVLMDKAKAASLYERAASLGAEEAMIKIGKLYCKENNGVERDYNKAFDWFRKAAEKGYDEAKEEIIQIADSVETERLYSYAHNLAGKMDPFGLYTLGYYYGEIQPNTEMSEDCYNKAFKAFIELKDKNMWVQKRIGDCYYNGVGITKDKSEAVKWYRKAAEQGYAMAQYNLGVCYDNGRGVSKDKSEAVKWYRKAAEQGYARAQYGLGFCYHWGRGVSIDMSEAVKWYRKAAEQGDAKAQYFLGFCYDGGEGVSKDKSEAVKWYRKAAEQGFAMAQYGLGCCYGNGEGVSKDELEAVKWYRKAAEQGFASAQFNLGVCYSNGEGVSKDLSEAVKWYRKAAEQRDAMAQYNLGVCYDNGEGVSKDEFEAVKWYRKAAEQGLAVAQFNLGVCYKNGEGVSKDEFEAFMWFRKAAEQGDASAKEMLERLGQ